VLALSTTALALILAYKVVNVTVVPYVVEVNNKGQITNVAEPASSTIYDEKIVLLQVSDFVSKWRSVTLDRYLQEKHITDLYKVMSGPIVKKINGYFRENNPYERGTDQIVDIQIISKIRLSQKTFEIEWLETTRDHNGEIIGHPAHHEAVIQYYIQAPTNMAQVRSNPLGIYFVDISWGQKDSKLIKGSK
jgi:type IV secretion system protein VirB5